MRSSLFLFLIYEMLKHLIIKIKLRASQGNRPDAFWSQIWMWHSNITHHFIARGGMLRNYIYAVCSPGVWPNIWNSYPCLRIFSHLNSWFDRVFFFNFFTNQDSFLFFLTSKTVKFSIFHNICLMELSSKDFWPCWDPSLRIFVLDESNPLGITFPYAVTCEYSTGS